jgi:hypothetical protein
VRVVHSFIHGVGVEDDDVVVGRIGMFTSSLEPNRRFRCAYQSRAVFQESFRKSGQSGVKYISEYAVFHSKKLDNSWHSPLVRMIKSGSGLPHVQSKDATVSSVTLSGCILPLAISSAN